MKKFHFDEDKGYNSLSIYIYRYLSFSICLLQEHGGIYFQVYLFAVIGRVNISSVHKKY